MQLSIWQQFSSNHSGFFWVVGTFETIDAAENAFAELRAMLFEIDRWHREHPEESRAAIRSSDPVPPEQALAAKYDVAWPSTIDWTGWGRYDWNKDFLKFDAQNAAEYLIDKAMTIIGRTLVVETPDTETWMTTEPFESILARLGAATIGLDLQKAEDPAYYENLYYYQRLTFTAPDAATAAQIEAAIRRYLGGDLTSTDNLPPWNDDEANFCAALPSSRLLKPQRVEALRQNWQKKYQDTLKLHMQPKFAVERLALRYASVVIRRTKLDFTLENFFFHNDALGVSALIAWLEANGCIVADYAYVRGQPESDDSV